MDDSSDSSSTKAEELESTRTWSLEGEAADPKSAGVHETNACEGHTDTFSSPEFWQMVSPVSEKLSNEVKMWEIPQNITGAHNHVSTFPLLHPFPHQIVNSKEWTTDNVVVLILSAKIYQIRSIASFVTWASYFRYVHFLSYSANHFPPTVEIENHPENEDYSSNVLKTFHGLRWAYDEYKDTPSVQWFMMIGDDVHVNTEAYLQSLDGLNPAESVYVGKHPYFYSHENFTWSGLFFSGCAPLTLSRHLLQVAYPDLEVHMERGLKLVSDTACDVILHWMAQELNSSLVGRDCYMNIDPQREWEIHELQCDNAVNFHVMPPVKIVAMEYYLSVRALHFLIKERESTQLMKFIDDWTRSRSHMLSHVQNVLPSALLESNFVKDMVKEPSALKSMYKDNCLTEFQHEFENMILSYVQFVSKTFAEPNKWW